MHRRVGMQEASPKRGTWGFPRTWAEPAVAEESGIVLGPGNILIVGPRSGKVPQNKRWLDGVAEGTLPGDHALGVKVLAVGRAPSELVSKPRGVDLCEHEALRQQVRHPVQPRLQTVRPPPVADLPELARALIKEPNTREQRMSGRTPGRKKSRALASHTFINLKTSARSSRPKEGEGPFRPPEASNTAGSRYASSMPGSR